jgi:hypothetical protein
MLLSTQLFDRIVGNSGSSEASDQRKATVLPAGCRRAVERRSARRLAFGHRSQICRDSGKKAGVWDTVMLQDISQQGIGCISEDGIDTGSTFVLKLVDKDNQTIRIRCKVCRCERGGFGNTAHLIGATFEHVIEQAPLRVNDEASDVQRWQDAAEAEANAVAVGQAADAGRSGGSAMARVAAQFLRAVDPLRAASLWKRRSDDFS